MNMMHKCEISPSLLGYLLLNTLLITILSMYVCEAQEAKTFLETMNCGKLLETGVCKWRHIKVWLSATSHRPAADLASKLKRMHCVWYDVGGSFQGEVWAGQRAKKKYVISEDGLVVTFGQLGQMWELATPSHHHQPSWRCAVVWRGIDQANT